MHYYPLEAWLYAHQSDAAYYPPHSYAPIMSAQRKRELAKADKRAEELARQFNEGPQ
jgi:hypothetical protein